MMIVDQAAERCTVCRILAKMLVEIKHQINRQSAGEVERQVEQSLRTRLKKHRATMENLMRSTWQIIYEHMAYLWVDNEDYKDVEMSIPQMKLARKQGTLR